MDTKLSNLLAEVFDMRSSEINISLTKADIDGWDSLKQMDLVTTLEKEYEIRLEMMEILSLISVKKIVDVLISKGIKIEN